MVLFCVSYAGTDSRWNGFKPMDRTGKAGYPGSIMRNSRVLCPEVFWGIVFGMGVVGIPALPIAAEVIQPPASAISICDASDGVAFHCSLGAAGALTVCSYRLPGAGSPESDDAEAPLVAVQVRRTLGGEVLWQWPESRAAAATFYYQEQVHVRSRSFHLWFERHGEMIDIVDHWTEGSHDSHFVGWIRRAAGEAGPRSMSCSDDEPFLAIEDLGGFLPHREIPRGGPVASPGVDGRHPETL